MSDFLHCTPAAFGKPVHRLGLALSFGIDEKGVREAADAGINYFLWTQMRTGAGTPGLRDVLKRDREGNVVCAGPTLGYFPGAIRKGCEKALRKLGVEYLDVFQLYWLGVGSAWTESTISELLALKEEGKVRAIGVSIHDRERAGRLAADSPLDMLMLRYNAAHPGAERDVFPHLPGKKRAVVAYTATSWRKLLSAPSGWTGPVPTAADCYRFCLSSAHVDVVLSGPASAEQLRENLKGLSKGPLTPEEDAWMRAFGREVHG